MQDAILSYSTIILVSLWSMWIARNKHVFENERPPVHVLSSWVYSLVHSINHAFDWVPAEKIGSLSTREVAWKGAPNDNTVALNVDGSCHGNPGRAGLEDCREITHEPSFLVSLVMRPHYHPARRTFGPLTWDGMLLGKGFQTSCLLLRFVTSCLASAGRGKPRHHFANEVHAIRALLNGNWECHIYHTSREGNQCANFFAKKGVASEVHLNVVMQAPPKLALSLLANPSAVFFPQQ